MALQPWDVLTGIVVELPKVVQRSIIWEFIAVIALRMLAKHMQHLMWNWIWCLLAVVVILSCLDFVCSLLVKVDCGIDSFSSKHKWHLAVNHHWSWFIVDGLGHVFGNPSHVVSVGMLWFICWTMSREHQLEGFPVSFAAAINVPKSFYLASREVNLGLKSMVGRGGRFWLLIREDPNGGVVYEIIDE